MEAKLEVGSGCQNSHLMSQCATPQSGNRVLTSLCVTFGRLAVSDFELGMDVIVLLIYCDVRFCILVHFRWAVHSKIWNIGEVAGPMYI